MNRLTERIKQVQCANKKLLCGFITAGYPSLAETEKLICGFEKEGVDILELGIPFSDPLADGPVIQDTSFHALKKGISLKKCFELVRRVRHKGVEIPIVFFSYINPIMHFGYDRFVQSMKLSGIDGLLVPDLPFGVEREFVNMIRKNNISCIRLLAPNSTRKRAQEIAQDSDAFLYYVSRKGVTGMQSQVRKGLARDVKKVQRLTSVPVLVGFGVSSAKQVKDISRVSDGVIIGSAILKKLKRTKSSTKTLRFVRSLRKACA